MKKTIATFVLSFIAVICFAQMSNPVSWTYEAKKKSADTYEIVATAQVRTPGISILKIRDRAALSQRSSVLRKTHWLVCRANPRK